MKTILFLCTHNSARSQLAEALANHFFKDRVHAYSAGTEATRVNPFAISVLQEKGIDTSGLYSKKVDEFRGKSFDLVVTVCDNAQKNCPFFPGAKNVIHRPFADPSAIQGTAEQKLAAFRTSRDEMFAWLQELLS